MWVLPTTRIRKVCVKHKIWKDVDMYACLYDLTEDVGRGRETHVD